MKPSVLVTRRLPASVLGRLEATCDVDLWQEREAIPRHELMSRVAGTDALVCLLTDTIDAGVLDAVQRLRKQSADVGNLKTSDQMTVDTEVQDGKDGSKWRRVR